MIIYEIRGWRETNFTEKDILFKNKSSVLKTS